MAEIVTERIRLVDPAGGAVVVSATVETLDGMVVAVLATNTSTRAGYGQWSLPGQNAQPQPILPGENAEERIPPPRRQPLADYAIAAGWGPA